MIPMTWLVFLSKACFGQFFQSRFPIEWSTSPQPPNLEDQVICYQGFLPVDFDKPVFTYNACSNFAVPSREHLQGAITGLNKPWFSNKVVTPPPTPTPLSQFVQ